MSFPSLHLRFGLSTSPLSPACSKSFPGGWKRGFRDWKDRSAPFLPQKAVTVKSTAVVATQKGAQRKVARSISFDD